MAHSMTGFGQHETSDDLYKVSLELKSVNHRFLDISIRLPRQYSALEDVLRKAVAERLTRGHIDVYITIRSVSARPRSVQVDLDLALGYKQALNRLGDVLGSPVGEDKLSELISKYPDVLRAEDVADDLEDLADLVRTAAMGALDALISMREAEGSSLAADLVNRLDAIRDVVKAIEARAPSVVEDYRQRLAERIEEFLGESQADPIRLATEIALFADRSSITEELVRLASHVEQFRSALTQGGAVGRRLDFLLQEMFREINTIGSKANDYEIATQVVTAKTELEKIREQVQNIE